jgi:hypothetical protein
MNLNDMIKICERGHEFIAYMNDFYSLEHDGIYAEEFQFTHEEIVDGISDYFKNEDALRGIMQYGADTVDREKVRDIILMKRGELVIN